MKHEGHGVLPFCALFFLAGCNYGTCEESGVLRIAPREGSLKIHEMHTDLSLHAEVATSILGGKLAFDPSEFVIQPLIGDSIFKKKGEVEYTLIREDSVYIQKFDCKARKAIIVSAYKTP